MKLSNIAWRIRPVGYLLLWCGVLFLAHCFIDISSRTHPLWIWHCQNLPEGESIPRTAAMSSMRTFQLQINWLFRELIFFPTAAMFIGGMILGIGRKPENHPNLVPEDTARKLADPQH
jgi:hypothetical protein